MLEPNSQINNFNVEDNNVKKRYILIIGILVAISVILIILIMLFSRGQDVQENSDNELVTPTSIPLPSPSITVVPSYPPTPIPQADDIFVDGIAVNNFKEEPARTLENGDLVLVENAEYQIIFNEPNQKFVLRLLGTNFEDSRLNAENDLMTRLGLDAMNMCRLYIEEEFNGTIYPFSHCVHESEM